ncbi:tetratricopeptide repeat protein [Dokdonella soli]|uniref:protein O-GlcNAc transferase n=1 Tax=Dokdonella soli TaxID=529810 RepID=A0ABN1ITH2_9GAMM
MSQPIPSDLSTALDQLVHLFDSGRPDLAASEAIVLRSRFPREAEVARLHAIALLQLGRVADARAALAEAHALAPQSVEVLCNLGSVLLAGGETAAALAALEQAIALEPEHPAALNGLGNARRAAGDLEGARDAYAGATRAAPDHSGAWLNLAAIELALGDHAAAERDARHALMLAPGHPEGLLLLGHLHAARRQYAEAEAAYAAGARSAPRDARFAYQCGLMAEEQKHLATAAQAHAHALALDPHFDRALGQLVFLRRQLCDWGSLDELSARLRARVAGNAGGIAPFGFLAEPASAAEQFRCARTHAAGIEAAMAPLRTRLAFARALSTLPATLRVGFVASGFGNHPTALLVVAMFEALREQAIEIHLFSTAPDDASALSLRLHAAAHAWHDAVGATPAALARTIHSAGIEVLVDLDGYCSGAMPEVFALRPAPVQVNWLAYPGTLAAPWIDYVIADRMVLPRSLCAQFSEQVVWLPRCFQPSDTTRRVDEPRARDACGLPETGVVYACFNNSFKINPASFERMLAVLRAVPDSVLWLLAAPDGADQRLRAEAVRRGVDATRLVFAPKVAHADYLARYRHADLFLDTAPYNAHTTASDSIWAGCPALTVPGETFASRVAASLNHHLGLPQLNARDDAEFIETAVRLGRDPAARAALRAELAERREYSGLFDMHGFATDFAAVLRKMAQRHRAGLDPAPLD